jgi:hypothetical protein
MMTLVLPLANCKKRRHRSQVASAPLTVNILKQPLWGITCAVTKNAFARHISMCPRGGRFMSGYEDSRTFHVLPYHNRVKLP